MSAGRDLTLEELRQRLERGRAEAPMKQSAPLRASGVLLALLSIGFSCLLLGAAPNAAEPCCPDGSSQAMLSSGSCAPSSSLPSAPSAGPPAMIVDRVDYSVPRWVAAPRIELVRHESVAAFGIRTTVLRL